MIELIPINAIRRQPVRIKTESFSNLLPDPEQILKNPLEVVMCWVKKSARSTQADSRKLLGTVKCLVTFVLAHDFVRQHN